MSERRQLRLGALLHGVGGSVNGWRHPESATLGWMFPSTVMRTKYDAKQSVAFCKPCPRDMVFYL